MPRQRVEGALNRVAHWVYSNAEHRFLQARYGVSPNEMDTLPLERFGLASEDRHDYSPSPWGVLPRVLSVDEIGADDVFIDFGCGMGRVLLEAARYPLKRVIGVEIVPEFTIAAAELISRNRHRLQCSDVEVVTADVLEYEVPDDVTVAYFHNPFGHDILRAVLAKLVASVDRRPRRLQIVHFNLAESRSLGDGGRARFVRYGRRRLRRWMDARYLILYEIVPIFKAVP